jgi:hypothetical protein
MRPRLFASGQSSVVLVERAKAHARFCLIQVSTRIGGTR